MTDEHSRREDRASRREVDAEMPKDAERNASDVVRRGGVAERDDQIEDVTRDTYGFPSAPAPSESRDERIARANRAAEQAGLPGVEVPESTEEAEEPERRREENAPE